MKPIYHPAKADITVEGILHALSDPVRVHIFANILRSECPQICSTFLKFDNRTLPKSTLSQHFRVLREAGLIYSERKGVEIHNRSRCEDSEDRFGPMIEAIVEAYIAQNKRKRRKS
jgi:DNA-binding transcriptional ArsR family regulator